MLFAVALGLFTLGCGKQEPLPPGVKDVSGAKITGKVLMNGKPVKLGEGEALMLTFYEDGKDPKDRVSSTGSAKAEDGSFAIDGPTKKGIPAGKYRVGLQFSSSGTRDYFEPVFAVGRTPLVVDVGAEPKQSFVIDVGTRTTKKE